MINNIVSAKINRKNQITKIFVKNMPFASRTRFARSASKDTQGHKAKKYRGIIKISLKAQLFGLHHNTRHKPT